MSSFPMGMAPTTTSTRGVREILLWWIPPTARRSARSAFCSAMRTIQLTSPATCAIPKYGARTPRAAGTSWCWGRAAVGLRRRPDPQRTPSRPRHRPGASSSCAAMAPAASAMPERCSCTPRTNFRHGGCRTGSSPRSASVSCGSAPIILSSMLFRCSRSHRRAFWRRLGAPQRVPVGLRALCGRHLRAL